MPSRSGARSIAACASAWAAAISPRRTPISARSPARATTVSAAPRSRARASISSVPRSAASRPSASISAARARIAQFSPRWSSTGRPAARARWARSIAPAAERTYITSSSASVASVVACSTPCAGPPGSCSSAIVASASRLRRGRRVADSEQSHVELLARRLLGREPLPGAGEDRNSLGGPSGEEEHAAQLDRRLGDRLRVLAALDDLRQRSDRLRRAGAGVRLAELEHHRVAVAVGGRLVERAGEQRGRLGGVAQRQRVAGRLAQQRHRVGIWRPAPCA